LNYIRLAAGDGPAMSSMPAVFAAIRELYTTAESLLESLLECLLECLAESLPESLFQSLLESHERDLHWE